LIDELPPELAGIQTLSIFEMSIDRINLLS